MMNDGNRQCTRSVLFEVDLTQKLMITCYHKFKVRLGRSIRRFGEQSYRTVRSNRQTDIVQWGPLDKLILYSGVLWTK